MRIIGKRLGTLAGEAAALAAGSAAFGLSVNMFITPGGITMGGFTGIATTVNYFIALPVGLLILLLNAPLLAIEIRTGHGGEGVIRTALGIAGTSLATDVIALFPYRYDDPLLCAVFGGLLMGAGGGLMLTRGFTTGGSDLCAYLLKRKIRRLSTGRLIMLIDAVIVISASVITRNFGGILYSFVAVWCYTTAFDRVMSGFGGARLAIIVSEKGDVISSEVSAKLRRGVTVLSGRGWYSGNVRNVLLCVVKRSQLFSLGELVRRTDTGAFMIVTDASAVMGEGFRNE